VFAEKGYEAATMTEIGRPAPARRSVRSTSFFPAQGSVGRYPGGRTTLRYWLPIWRGAGGARASDIDTKTLVEALFGLVWRAPPAAKRRRGAAAGGKRRRMDDEGRDGPPSVICCGRHIATILRARFPRAVAWCRRAKMAVVGAAVDQGPPTRSATNKVLAGRATALRELRALATQYMEQRLR